MNDNEIEALAAAMVDKTGHLHTPGDRCPCCGYDTYWDEDSREASIQRLAALMRAALSR